MITLNENALAVAMLGVGVLSTACFFWGYFLGKHHQRELDDLRTKK